MAHNTNENDKLLRDRIRDVVLKFCGPGSSLKAPEEYKLVFSFDDYEYSTIFEVDYDGFRNGCLKIRCNIEDYPSEIYSYITSNSPGKKCFKPMLKDNLPPDVKQTDVLQVLISKLKFIYLNTKSIKLTDNARVFNYGLISEWRLLRDEPSIYEKYGYTSEHFNSFRDKIKIIKWQRIKDYIIPRTGKTLEDMWNIVFKEIDPPSDTETIPLFMRRISLDNIEKSLTNVPKFKTEEEEHKYIKKWIRVSSYDLIEKKTFLNFIIDALESIGVSPPKENMTLTLQSNSELWKHWNSRLVFRSFDRIMEGGKRSKCNVHHRRKTIRKTTYTPKKNTRSKNNKSK
jgi:hypothetical protein